MNWFYNTVALLKEYGRFSWAVWDLVLANFIAVYGLCTNSYETSVFSVLLLALVAWEISDVYLFRERDSYKDQLADRSDEVVLLKGEVLKLEEEVSVLKKLAATRKDNPIKSNRIVSDQTFAVRLKGFAEGCRCSDQASEEEAVYLASVAERLLKWQTRTVRKDSEEYRYLERLGLMPVPSPNTDDRTEEKQKAECSGKRSVTGKRTKKKSAGNEDKD